MTAGRVPDGPTRPIAGSPSAIELERRVEPAGPGSSPRVDLGRVERVLPFAVAAGVTRGPFDQLAELDLSLSMDGGVKHYVCSSGRVAFCGLDLSGAHICPGDLSCGCVVCPDCDRVHRATIPACPLTGGPCDCV